MSGERLGKYRATWRMGSTRPRSKKRAKKFDALSRFRDMENQGFGIESEGVRCIRFAGGPRTCGEGDERKIPRGERKRKTTALQEFCLEH